METNSNTETAARDSGTSSRPCMCRSRRTTAPSSTPIRDTSTSAVSLSRRTWRNVPTSASPRGGLQTSSLTEPFGFTATQRPSMKASPFRISIGAALAGNRARAARASPGRGDGRVRGGRSASAARWRGSLLVAVEVTGEAHGVRGPVLTGAGFGDEGRGDGRVAREVGEAAAPRRCRDRGRWRRRPRERRPARPSRASAGAGPAGTRPRAPSAPRGRRWATRCAPAWSARRRGRSG